MVRMLLICVVLLVPAPASEAHAQQVSATRPAATQPAAAGGRTVRVAAVQCSSRLGEVEANRTKLAGLVEEAARQEAKIIVLPETAVTGYLSQDLKTNWRLPGWPLERAFRGKDPLPTAEPVPGPSTDFFCRLAGRLSVYLTIPLLEIERPPATNSADRPSPRLFNTVCLASPEGRLVAHYRKLTPWPYPEKSWATSGDRGVQFYDTEYGRVGLAICYDIHNILEHYEPHHIWALLYPIAWVDDNHPAPWFWHRLPERVRPFGIYLIGANWSVDEPQDWFGYGFSTILSPAGEVLASAHSLHGSEIVYADIPTATGEPGR